MSGKSKSTTTSNTSNSFEPWVTRFGQNLVNSAGQQVAENGWQPYIGPTQGEFGEGFGAANSYLQQMLGQVSPETEMASSGLADFLMSVDPTRSVASFMNPYVDQVLQPTIRNINEAADAKGGQLASQATMAGAYGDSSHGVQKALLERDRQRSIGDATSAAYDKAFTAATGARSDELSKFLQGIGAGGTLGQQRYGQETGLAQLLASLGQTEQQANQSGIQTEIALNQQNQDAPLKQYLTLAQMLGMIPKNTTGKSTSTTSQPDNSMLAFISSLI